MKLRKLEKKDAPLMLEWMHDDDVVKNMGTNFKEKTLSDCESFIEYSLEDENNMHLAIVNEDDSYMGTVSLKHIDKENKCAEFAITVRKEAMGKGYSSYGMKEIIRIGKEAGISDIYWCVSKENVRAVRFYDKNEYTRVESVPQNLKENYTEEQLEDYIWYLA